MEYLRTSLFTSQLVRLPILRNGGLDRAARVQWTPQLLHRRAALEHVCSFFTLDDRRRWACCLLERRQCAQTKQKGSLTSECKMCLPHVCRQVVDSFGVSQLPYSVLKRSNFNFKYGNGTRTVSVRIPLLCCQVARYIRTYVGLQVYPIGNRQRRSRVQRCLVSPHLDQKAQTSRTHS